MNGSTTIAKVVVAALIVVAFVATGTRLGSHEVRRSTLETLSSVFAFALLCAAAHVAELTSFSPLWTCARLFPGTGTSGDLIPPWKQGVEKFAVRTFQIFVDFFSDPTS
jgi:hypothetical protein